MHDKPAGTRVALGWSVSSDMLHTSGQIVKRAPHPVGSCTLLWAPKGHYSVRTELGVRGEIKAGRPGRGARPERAQAERRGQPDQNHNTDADRADVLPAEAGSHGRPERAAQKRKAGSKDPALQHSIDPPASRIRKVSNREPAALFDLVPRERLVRLHPPSRFALRRGRLTTRSRRA